MRQRKFFTTILAELAMVLMLPAGAVAANSSKVLYKFKGGNDAGHPFAGLIFDAAGNLYGTTVEGGGICDRNQVPCGTVFKLSPNSDGSWKESILYRFKGGSDGAGPYAGLIFDGAGNLYGTTLGTVFRLKPNSDGTWTESVLYSFCQLNNCADGEGSYAGLTLDGAGNLYGTTSGGGSSRGGTVFKLAPNSDGTWTESVLHSFSGPDEGSIPYGGVIFDSAGNLYGSTSVGGNGGNGGGGTVFKLTPNSNGTWKEHVLHAFTTGKDGAVPWASFTSDAAGNLYGTTTVGGSPTCNPPAGCGVVFKLNTSHKFSVVHTFTNPQGASPYAGLTFDTAGNLYGTARNGGSTDDGVVFKLAPRQGGGWAYSVLKSFKGSPGINPYGDLVFDPAGNLYGTTWDCAVGQECRGIVFEVAP